ncbi:MAG: hypothetical protein VYA84_05650 [Planctomycetota bacterium]|nr:hypothetical protein [Planctomycetota bacterium]
MSAESNENSDESAGSLTSTLLYGLSLPERTARSASLIVGGFVNETAARLIPAAFRSSRSYTVFVQQAIDMMVNDVGGVQNGTPAAPNEETKLARKAVGGLLDIAGTATLHLSPMTVLAIFNDLAYGSSYYLRKLSEELKREGIIDNDSSIDHVSDLVEALESTSGKAVEAMDTPPISISGLTDTIARLSDEMSKAEPTSLLPQAEVQRIWSEMERAATAADVGLWDISTTMTMFALNRITLTSRGALSTIDVAGNLFDEHIIGHYSDALVEISDHGLYATLADASAPYLEGVWENFAADRETWTEEMLTGRLIEKGWQSMRGWFLPSTKKDP